MNAGKNYQKAREHAQANANHTGEPRYLHQYGGVWWIEKTPGQGSIQVDPEPNRGRDPARFIPGNHVEISPHFDLWMRGARYGVVRRTDKDGIVHVKMDNTRVRKIQKFHAKDLRLVGSQAHFGQDPMKKKHVESATMAQLRRPKQHQHASGRGHKKLKYEVISLDVWGNEEEGFEVNAAYHTNKFITVQVREHIINVGTPYQSVSYSPTDRAILAALVREGFLKNGVTTKDVEIDGEAEYTLYLQDKKTGEPVFHLEFKGRTL